jgi:hypothetical protein
MSASERWLRGKLIARWAATVRRQYVSSEELKTADRAALVSYLESWGFACHDNETTEELRTAALLNHETETGDESRADQST